MYYFLQELLTIIRLTLSMMTGYQGVMNDWGEIPANAIDMSENWRGVNNENFSEN